MVQVHAKVLPRGSLILGGDRRLYKCMGVMRPESIWVSTSFPDEPPGKTPLCQPESLPMAPGNVCPCPSLPSLTLAGLQHGASPCLAGRCRRTPFAGEIRGARRTPTCSEPTAHWRLRRRNGGIPCTPVSVATITAGFNSAPQLALCCKSGRGAKSL